MCKVYTDMAYKNRTPRRSRRSRRTRASRISRRSRAPRRSRRTRKTKKQTRRHRGYQRGGLPAAAVVAGVAGRAYSTYGQECSAPNCPAKWYPTSGWWYGTVIGKQRQGDSKSILENLCWECQRQRDDLKKYGESSADSNLGPGGAADSLRR